MFISTNVKVAMLIGQERKSFTDANFIKNRVLSIVGDFCPDNVDKFKKVHYLHVQ